MYKQIAMKYLNNGIEQDLPPKLSSKQLRIARGFRPTRIDKEFMKDYAKAHRFHAFITTPFTFDLWQLILILFGLVITVYFLCY